MQNEGYFGGNTKNDLEHHPRITSLGSEFARLNIGSEITVRTEDLGADTWQQMVEATQNDRIERGFDLTRRGETIERSQVFLGKEGGFGTPLKEALRQTLSRKRPFGTFHTHFFDTTVNTKAPTGTFSLKDLNYFKANEGAKVMGMLDIGGAHVLIKTSPVVFHRDANFPPGDFIVDAFNQTRKTDGFTIDALKRIGRILENHGMIYYYTPNLAPKNGLIELKNVKTLDALPPRV